MSEKHSNPPTRSENFSSQIYVFASVLITLGGFVFYYSMSDQFSDIARILTVIATSTIGLVVISMSSVGKRGLEYLGGVRTEVRRVVWPNRQETLQMSVVVLIAVVIMGLFLWGVDSLFIWLIELIV